MAHAKDRKGLRTLPVLRKLAPQRRERLLHDARERELRAGEVLFREGDRAEAVFLILAGYVRIDRDLGDGGPAAPIATRRPGDWLGELSLEPGALRSATVVAESLVNLLELARPRFMAAVREAPEAGLDLLSLVSRRLRESDTAFVEAIRKRAGDLQRANERLGAQLGRFRDRGHAFPGFEAFAGTSRAGHRIREAAAQAARSSRAVLLVGEPGTGKRLLAALVHGASPRRGGAFVTFDASLAPEVGIEAELFGYARGAIAGARQAASGRIADAEAGTLYLAHLDRVPLLVQAQLVRLFVVGEYQRVGEGRARRADIRLVASLAGEPELAEREGRLRAELGERLGALRITLPPLRERRSDVASVVLALSERLADGRGAPLLRFSRPALRVLAGAPLPGNAGDLRAEVERLYQELPPGASVELADLHGEVLQAETVRYGDALRAFKLALIGEALREAGGSPTRAAERLGLHASNLHRMLRDLGLAKDRAEHLASLSRGPSSNEKNRTES